MQLFYTVVSVQDTPQASPIMSLGGFKSSSLVPNSEFGSLFQDISSYTIQQRKPEYIGLVLQNTTSQDTSDFTFWFSEVERSYCKFRIAVVQLNDNGEMEHIPSPNSKPLYSQFYDASEVDPLRLENLVLLPGQMVGIWIEKTLNYDVIKDNSNCDYLFEHKDDDDSFEEAQSLNFSYEVDSVIIFGSVSPIYRVGDTIQVIIVKSPLPDGTVYTWTSLDETVATVDQDGVVICTGPGEAMIQASFGRVRGICSFEVVIN